MTIRKVLLTCAFLCLALVPSTAADKVYMQRGIFFATRPFGALAWIDNVASDTGAAGAGWVYDLSQSPTGCIELPFRAEYWFLINHRKNGSPGVPGYFAVRISGYTPSKSPEDALRIHRNAEWLDAKGRTLPAVTKGPSDLKIGARDFTVLNGGNDLRALEEGIGEWHATPEKSLAHSWTNRKIFASDQRVAEATKTDLLILGARLMKFSAIDSNFSVRPVVFGFNPSRLPSFTVSVSAPSFDVENQETEIRVNSRCQAKAVGFFDQPRGFFRRLFGASN